MKMKKILKPILWAAVIVFVSCGKEFLAVKQNKNQVVPNKIADFQGILDNWRELNVSSSHELSIIGADEYYISDNHWDGLRDLYQKNGYIWADDVYAGQDVDDWNAAYHRILLANLALEGLARISPLPDQRTAWEQAKGSALFFRAWNHYQLAQLFCKPYDSRTAGADLGIPLRLEADVSVKMGRSTLENTYHHIIQDLGAAADLLVVTPLNKLQPAKPAAYALLARVYLMMGDYSNARQSADRCLALENELLDFNQLDLSLNYLFPTVDYGESNPEILFFCFMDNITITNSSRYRADTLLLKLYKSGDLRRQAYFRDVSDRKVFKGSYRGGVAFFTGLATDEVYLTRAECAVREGDLETAYKDLNFLLSKRFDSDTFRPIAGLNRDELLEFVIKERRKELVLRGIRWEDLRRLNKEVAFQTTLIREVNGQRYELTPESARWVWPIPDNEISTGNIEQNRR